MTEFSHDPEKLGPYHGSRLGLTLDRWEEQGLASPGPESLAFKRILAAILESEDPVTPHRYCMAANAVIVFAEEEYKSSEGAQSVERAEGSALLAQAGQLDQRKMEASAHLLALSTYGEDFAQQVTQYYELPVE